MRFADLVAASAAIAATRSRKQKAAILADVLRIATSDELATAVAYLSGRLPQGRIGIGYSALRSADPGVAVQEPSLEIGSVDATLSELMAIQGTGSAQRRLSVLRGLLAAATADEQDFFMRLLLGNLRQGSLDGVMVDAIALANGLPVPAVRRAAMLSGDPGAVAVAAARDGAAGLAGFRIEVFRPVQPMLAQTAEDVTEAIAATGTASVEWKLDGARIQVHKDGDEVGIYSRRLNEVTSALPEVVEAVSLAAAESLVLDGEVIALAEDGRPHAFQTTMRRFGRRLDVAELRRTLPLSSFFFDCLYRDGADLVDHSAAERFDHLASALPGELLIPRLITDDPDEAQAFTAAALEAGHEGVMIKAIDCTYEAGARRKAWLKVKQAHTLDLVVLAAEWGSGRRRGWLSNLHLGARDPSGGFVMLGKTFKGMTDEMLAWQTERFQEIETSRDQRTVYVNPEQVVEIAFNDVQESPIYRGGLALRFARVKGYRPDKGPEDADTIDTVRAIFDAQA